jgi:hypothetical protein
MITAIYIAIVVGCQVGASAYAFGWRFKKVTWNWTSLCVGIHAGRNPATGARFAYVGLGYGLGLDFYYQRGTR